MFPPARTERTRELYAVLGGMAIGATHSFECPDAETKNLLRVSIHHGCKRGGIKVRTVHFGKQLIVCRIK